MPMMAFIVTVLPLPLSPTSATCERSATASETPRNTLVTRP